MAKEEFKPEVKKVESVIKVESYLHLKGEPKSNHAGKIEYAKKAKDKKMSFKDWEEFFKKY